MTDKPKLKLSVTAKRKMNQSMLVGTVKLGVTSLTPQEARGIADALHLAALWAEGRS